MIAYNISDPPVHTRDGTTLRFESDFKYLGSWINSSEKDLKIRKGQAWSVLHSMKKVWTSTLSARLKRSLFVATVESVLLYGAETWTLTTSLEKSLDGCYTRMLRMALNIPWQDHMRNSNLYAGWPKAMNADSSSLGTVSATRSLPLAQPSSGSPPKARPRVGEDVSPL